MIATMTKIRIFLMGVTLQQRLLSSAFVLFELEKNEMKTLPVINMFKNLD